MPQQVIIEVESHEMSDAVDTKSPPLSTTRDKSEDDISALPQEQYAAKAALGA